MTEADVEWCSFVKTEEGNAAARSFGLPEAETTVEDSIDGLLAKVCNYSLPQSPVLR